MKPFETLLAPACPLAQPNIDTDQLIPARFMETPRSEGYGRFLLHDLRRDASGAMRVDMPLNDPLYREARTLIAGRNFGCGSSREAAVYVLVDSGFQCVVASGFGDIFASNAAKNGLLTAVVSEEKVAELLADPDVLADAPVRVDLVSQTISTSHRTTPFEIREDRKLRLINGWSDVDLTRSYDEAISQYLVRDQILRPWAAAPDLGPYINTQGATA